jgi:hypothetical protein
MERDPRAYLWDVQQAANAIEPHGTYNRPRRHSTQRQGMKLQHAVAATKIPRPAIK